MRKDRLIHKLTKVPMRRTTITTNVRHIRTLTHRHQVTPARTTQTNKFNTSSPNRTIRRMQRLVRPIPHPVSRLSIPIVKPSYHFTCQHHTECTRIHRRPQRRRRYVNDLRVTRCVDYNPTHKYTTRQYQRPTHRTFSRGQVSPLTRTIRITGRPLPTRIMNRTRLTTINRTYQPTNRLILRKHLNPPAARRTFLQRQSHVHSRIRIRRQATSLSTLLNTYTISLLRTIPRRIPKRTTAHPTTRPHQKLRPSNQAYNTIIKFTRPIIQHTVTTRRLITTIANRRSTTTEPSHTCRFPRIRRKSRHRQFIRPISNTRRTVHRITVKRQSPLSIRPRPPHHLTHIKLVINTQGRKTRQVSLRTNTTNPHLPLNSRHSRNQVSTTKGRHNQYQIILRPTQGNLLRRMPRPKVNIHIIKRLRSQTHQTSPTFLRRPTIRVRDTSHSKLNIRSTNRRTVQQLSMTLHRRLPRNRLTSLTQYKTRHLRNPRQATRRSQTVRIKPRRRKLLTRQVTRSVRTLTNGISPSTTNRTTSLTGRTRTVPNGTNRRRLNVTINHRLVATRTLARVRMIMSLTIRHGRITPIKQSRKLRNTLITISSHGPHIRRFSTNANTTPNTPTIQTPTIRYQHHVLSQRHQQRHRRSPSSRATRTRSLPFTASTSNHTTSPTRGTSELST